MRRDDDFVAASDIPLGGSDARAWGDPEPVPNLDPRDDPMITLEKLVRLYAFCPERSKPVVPVHSSDDAAGMSFDNFKRWLKPYTHGRADASLASLWEMDPRRMTVADLRMRPDMRRPTFEEDGRLYVNTYTPPLHQGYGGNIRVWHDFLAHLLPDNSEREYVERWIAFKFRNPATCGPGLLMVAHQTYGTGRGTLGRILERLFGLRYVKRMEFESFAGGNYQAQYNEWRARSLIAIVNEAKQEAGRQRFAASVNAFERIKELIEPGGGLVHINRKGLSNYDAPTFCSIIVASNHADALSIPADDRRLFVAENGDPLSVDLRDRVHAWIDRPENISALASHLRGLDLGSYDPFAAPPMTEAKAKMADLAASDIDRAVAHVLKHIEGEAFTADQVVEHVGSLGGEYTLPERWEAVVKAKVQRDLHRIGIRDGKNDKVTINGVRRPSYARTRDAARKWTQSSRLLEEVRKSHGMREPADHA